VSNTAGQASFAMNFTLLFSLVFTGFLVNVYSIPGAPRLGLVLQGCTHLPAAAASAGLTTWWLCAW
jgi:hypothetical protein